MKKYIVELSAIIDSTDATEADIKNAAIEYITVNTRYNPANFTWSAQIDQDIVIVTRTTDKETRAPLNFHSPYIAPRLYAALEIIRRKYAHSEQEVMIKNIPAHLQRIMPQLVNAGLMTPGSSKFTKDIYTLIERPYYDARTHSPLKYRTASLYTCPECNTRQRQTTIPCHEPGFYLSQHCYICETSSIEFYGPDY